ncbi:MAG TPA: hypothetical protein VIK84_02335 [Haloplasmataceae bacterium]
MGKVTVKKENEVIFQGNILDLPFKEEYIIKKSIEVFDDDDPCIIHKSYVIKLFVDDLLSKTNLRTSKTVNLQDYKADLEYLNIDLDNCFIFYEE